MGLGEKIKKVFLVEEEDEPVKVQPVASAATAAPLVTTPAVSTADLAVQGEISAEVNQKMVDELCIILDEKNLPGPDYLEVRNAANALKEVLPDDNQRLKTAFITIKTTSPAFDKDVVLKSIDTYIGIIKQEYAEEKKALNAKRQSSVGAREVAVQSHIDEIAKGQADIEKLQKQIADINASIVQHNVHISELKNEIVQNKNLLLKQELDFDASVNFMIKKLENDKQTFIAIL
ncbi:MAG: hypothetical protein LBV39_06595 [Bacteroidales bacterium]|jgi:hypothetical protein|nr:hypothetical protein [Bacteroidales bacterium]